MTTKGKSPVGRASYVHVFQPQKDEKSGKSTYSITLLFPKNADISVLKAAYQAAIAERWPGKKPGGIRSPFRDGDEVDDEGTRKRGPEYAGMTYVTFRTDASLGRKPGVVDAGLNEVTQSDGKLYSGAYVKVSFSAYAYERDGNRGVSFGLNNVQVIKDGERFDGRVDATEDFDAVEDSSANNEAMF